MSCRVLGATALAAALSACVSIPPPGDQNPVDDDAGARGDGGAGDASPQGCSANGHTPIALETTQGLILRDLVAADVNGDGCEDLVASDIDGTNGYGLYIFLAPQPASGKLEFHGFVETQTRPLAFQMVDLTGSSALDILVFGHEADESAGLVEVYELTPGGSTLVAPMPVVKRQTQLTPVPGRFETDYDRPVNVVTGDFDGNGRGGDIAISDLFNLELFFLETGLDELKLEAPVRIGADGLVDGDSWLDINKLFAVPDASGGDSLLVMQQLSMTTLRPNDYANRLFYEPVQQVTMFSGKQIDLDGTAPLDVIGGSNNSLFTYILSGDAPVAVEDLGRKDVDNDDRDMWNLVIMPDPVDVDDVVAIDRGIRNDQEPGLVYTEPELDFVEIVGIGASSDTIVTNQTKTISLSGIDPVSGAAGDFDLDGTTELRIVGRDGTTQCFHRDQAQGLVPCS